MGFGFPLVSLQNNSNKGTLEKAIPKMYQIRDNKSGCSSSGMSFEQCAAEATSGSVSKSGKLTC